MPKHPTVSGAPGAIATLDPRAGVLRLALAWWSSDPEAPENPAMRRTDALVLPPGAWAIIGTGISLALPPGVGGRLTVCPALGLRSGLLAPERTLDPGFRGELLTRLLNAGDEPRALPSGTPLLELRVFHVTRMTLDPVTALPADPAPRA